MREGRRSAVWIVALVLFGLGAAGCEERLPQRRVESIPELSYPRCDSSTPGDELIGAGHLRPGPTMRERNVVERFEIRRRDCHEVVTVRQEWPLGIADVEVVFDVDGRPLRAWKRMTLPGTAAGENIEDIRRYELRTSPVTLKKRPPRGPVEFREIRGAAPVAVIGPGRGLISMWIRAAKLAEGEKVRGPVLDFRETIETIRDVTLRRDANRYEPTYGRTVRVYTVYGRETVFADENDIVIGDLAGLRPDALVKDPPPPVLPSRTAPDPIGTP